MHASPDYAEVAPDEATADFYSRMRAYEEAYETVDEAEGLAYIKLRDLAAGAGSLTASRLSGFLPSRIVYLLLNAQLAFRPIFLCRHGESRDNIAGRVGGDSSLSSAGRDFASRLRSFVEALPPAERPAAVWTSTLRRTVQTARGLGPGWPTVQWRALDEIDAGKAEGLTYGEMRAQSAFGFCGWRGAAKKTKSRARFVGPHTGAARPPVPEEHAARSADKLRYRYPRGESYLDVIARLEPVIVEARSAVKQTNQQACFAHPTPPPAPPPPPPPPQVERQRSPVLIVGHQAVLRALLGYFTTRRIAEVPHSAFARTRANRAGFERRSEQGKRVDRLERPLTARRHHPRSRRAAAYGCAPHPVQLRHAGGPRQPGAGPVAGRAQLVNVGRGGAGRRCSRNGRRRRAVAAAADAAGGRLNERASAGLDGRR